MLLDPCMRDDRFVSPKEFTMRVAGGGNPSSRETIWLDMEWTNEPNMALRCEPTFSEGLPSRNSIGADWEQTPFAGC